MHTNTLIAFTVAAVIALAAMAYVWYPRTNDSSSLATYTSESLGIAFQYPERYALDERDGEGRQSIVLTEAGAPLPEAGEGPTAITIDIFRGALDGRALDRWITETSASNFQLPPDDGLIETSLAGRDAYAYGWDGLYLGNSIVFSNGDTVYMLSVTYLDADDQIRADFAQVAASFEVR